MSTSNDTPSKTDILITEENLSQKLDMLKSQAKLSKISHDEEESPEKEPFEEVLDSTNKQSVKIKNDDDIMFVDEDISKTEQPQNASTDIKTEDTITANCERDAEIGEKTVEKIDDIFSKKEKKESTNDNSSQILNSGKQDKEEIEKTAKNKKKISKEELQAICKQIIQKNLGNKIRDYQNKLKSIDQGIGKDRKKTILDIDFKSKKQNMVMPGTRETVKVNRSLGTQDFSKKAWERQNNLAQLQNPNNNNVAKQLVARNVKTLTESPQQQKPPQKGNNSPILVARLGPANYPVFKIPISILIKINRIIRSKTPSSMINTKNLSTSQKVTEKRQHDRIISATIDLTDDEPPVKVNNQIESTNDNSSQILNSGKQDKEEIEKTTKNKKVFSKEDIQALCKQIIQKNLGNKIRDYQNKLKSIDQGTGTDRKKTMMHIDFKSKKQNMVMPGTRETVKKTLTESPRQQKPPQEVIQQSYTAFQSPQYAVRMSSSQTGSYPAPPLCTMNVYRPLIRMGLPPRLVLKLTSESDNMFTLSWQIECDPIFSYELIVSYQLFVYQESLSTRYIVLWKRMSILNAIPNAMTFKMKNFEAGFKYHFAMRAVGNRSCVGPMSMSVGIVINRNL